MNDPFGDTRLTNIGDGPGNIRLWPVALVVIAVFTIFTVRLFQLQILQGDYLASRSQANYVRTVRLEAQRGAIVDREGRTIAASRLAYGVDVIPHEVRNPWRTYSVLAQILDEDAATLSEKVGQPRGRRRFQPVTLARDLPHDAWAKVDAHRYAMPGVELRRQPLRDYVYGPMAAQLLGTIGEIGSDELSEPAYADYRSGETIGKTGLEATNEQHLRGSAGGENRVVDVAGREIETIGMMEPIPGGRLVLTLDLDLQRVAEEAFARPPLPPDPEDPEAGPRPQGDYMGALVAMDPRSGDVLAIVSAPSYDANVFAGGVDRETWRALNSHEWRPLRNRAIAGVYPPGSTYKAIVAAAGLAEGVIDETTVVNCPGHFRLGRRVYRCWKRGGHGPVDLGQALAGSCDVYFYELGKTLGVDTLARYARLFGLGRATGLPIRGEVNGLVPTPEWKMRARGERWIDGETISLSIGQGANLTTPIQLAVAYSVIANGGDVVEPRIVLRRETWDGEVLAESEPVFRERSVIAPAILEIVTRGLSRVVQDPSGTGRRAAIPGISVAGKSGTTQVVSLDLIEGLEPEEGPLKYRDHALFAAFAPVEAPEIVVVAVAEHAGMGGGAVAAPMVQKVFAEYFRKKEERVPTQVAALAIDPELFAPGAPRRIRADRAAGEAIP